MANPGLPAIKNKIDDVVNDVATDLTTKTDTLRKAKKYLLGKIAGVEALLAANPPSATNVPTTYQLCDMRGKVFALFEDGVVKPLP